MTDDTKELLLKDIAMRMPYGVLCNYNGDIFKIAQLDAQNMKVRAGDNWSWVPIEDVTLYLRPLKPVFFSGENIMKLLNVRFAARYGKDCAYIKDFIKINEIQFRTEPPYVGSIAVWFSFKQRYSKNNGEIVQTEYSKVEYLCNWNDITTAEIDWLIANHYDIYNLYEKELAIPPIGSMYMMKD